MVEIFNAIRARPVLAFFGIGITELILLVFVAIVLVALTASRRK